MVVNPAKGEKMTRTYIAIFMILVLIVFAPFLVVKWLYGDNPAFNPTEFVEDYINLLAGLASMVVGFFLADVFWAGKLKQDRIQRTRRVMGRFFLQLRDLVSQCEELLSQEYSDNDLRKAQERDDKILEIFSLMRVTKEALLMHYPVEEVSEDDQLAKAMIGLFWSQIIPAINDLGARRKVRGEVDGIVEQLRVIKQGIAQVPLPSFEESHL